MQILMEALVLMVVAVGCTSGENAASTDEGAAAAAVTSSTEEAAEQTSTLSSPAAGVDEFSVDPAGKDGGQDADEDDDEGQGKANESPRWRTPVSGEIKVVAYHSTSMSFADELSASRGRLGAGADLLSSSAR